MKKELSVTGPYGTFKGVVCVKFNYRHDIKKYHNPSTHDDDDRKVSYHVVTGQIIDINGSIRNITLPEFTVKSNAVDHAEIMEKSIRETLTKLAYEPPVKPVLSVEEQLKEMGYTT